MTARKCFKTCEADEYTYAGLERECYCGNSMDPENGPAIAPMGNCLTPCSGDSSQNCGGSGYIGLYRACGSS
ncbi:WSC domain-containing protein [Aspergillus lucknowensis]|uniref:WSC domain-containing protein n=1 Tax=Aspergillus lucknowensis TaxID=176173 RepID=A0ABR4M4S2_9EURO